MWDSYPGGYQSYRNDVALATRGHDYGPQFGPAVPRDYYEDDEDEGYEFGSNPFPDVPADWDDFLGINPGEE